MKLRGSEVQVLVEERTVEKIEEKIVDMGG